jgi:hypothetical protein
VCFSTLAYKLSSGAHALPDVLYSLTNYIVTKICGINVDVLQNIRVDWDTSKLEGPV